MNTSDTHMDMIHGLLTKKILLFTLPIVLSSMLQQLFQLADTSIVGYFNNSNALAAVGTNGEIIALIITLSSGLSIGTNVLIANQIGQKKTDRISRILHTSILFAIIIGFLGLIAGQCLTKPLLLLIQTPAKVMPYAELYLRIYLLGYPFLLLYDFGAAILRARGDSRYPFIALTIAGILNVFLNIFFVILFRLGVMGVAIATDLSTMLSAGMILYRLKKEHTIFHLSFRKLHINTQDLSLILKIGIPSAIQGAVFCFANIFVQASVNSFGPMAIAGSTIAMNFEYFAYYVITAFGQTATTFTSQNYAANQKKRCQQILWLCITFSTLCSLIIIVPILLFRNQFSGLFSTEQSVIEQAGIRILCILLFEPICSLYEIPAGVLRGAGRSLLPAIFTVVGTCAFRIIWICTIFRVNPSLKTLYMAFPISWVLTITFFVFSFVILKPLDLRKCKKCYK